MEGKYTTREQIDALKKEIEIAERKSSKKSGKKKRSRIGHIIDWVLFGVALFVLGSILSSVLIAKSSGQTPAVLGYQLYVVQSGSMEPTFPVGTIILAKIPANPAALAKGDVVTFTDNGMTITHRIVEVKTENGNITYRTKGDNPQNSIDPGILTPDRVKAVFIMKIPFT